MFKNFNIEFKIIIGCFILFLLMNTCSNTSQSKRIKNLELQAITSDSLMKTMINNCVTKKDLEIQGLKNEKRFIEATDRKILDVKRQNDIENEIKKLTKSE